MKDDLHNSNLIARWAAGELSPEEQKTLEDKEQLKNLATVLKDIDQWKMPHFKVNENFTRLKQLQKRQGRTIVLRRLLSVAASIVILIGGYTFYRFQAAPVELSTGIGQTLSHKLPAGSTITIDAQSTASYSKRKYHKKRTITLHGQAYFDVSHGAPFTVHTLQGSIQVLGTEFNVSVTDNALEVLCYEGSVQVNAGEQSTILKKQEGVHIINQQLQQLNFDSKAPDWVNGITRFESTVLVKVIEELKKYYEVELELPEKYEQLEYTGILVHDDLKTALELIFTPMGIKYKLTKKNKVLFG